MKAVVRLRNSIWRVHLERCLIPVVWFRTCSGSLPGCVGEVQSLPGVSGEQLVDVLGCEAGLLPQEELLQGEHGRGCPVHLHVHQELLQHQQRAGRQLEVILTSGLRERQQQLHTNKQTASETAPHTLSKFNDKHFNYKARHYRSNTNFVMLRPSFYLHHCIFGDLQWRMNCRGYPCLLLKR